MKSLRMFRAAALAVGLSPWALALSSRAAHLFWPTFHALCHQLRERTLFLFGSPMIVCSRCAGVFAGVALGALGPLPARLLPYGRTLVLAALLLAVLDVATQDLGLHAPFHPTRLLTGLLLGWTATAFLVATLAREARLTALHPGPRAV